MVQFRKTYHGGTEARRRARPSDHRVIGPSEQPFVFRSPDHPISRSPDPLCLRASVVDFLQTAALLELHAFG